MASWLWEAARANGVRPLQEQQHEWVGEVESVLRIQKELANPASAAWLLLLLHSTPTFALAACPGFANPGGA
eukprot:1079417-Pelagomonas_calceolata.AAC.1